MNHGPTTVLVTGGTGFLGSQVVQVLQRRGMHHVVVASRDDHRNSKVALQKIQYVRLDLTADVVLPPGPQVIIHLAGEKRNSSQMEAVNHLGTRRLVEAAVRTGVRRFVYASSVGVYGASPHAGVVTESTTHTPRSLYEATKEAGEAIVRTMCTQAGIEFVVLQPSNVIGVIPGRSYPLLGLMKMVLRGRFAWFGAGAPWANYVAVEDVAAAVVCAAESAPASATFIINTPEPLRRVVTWVAEALGVEAPGRSLPLWLGRLAAGGGSAVARVSGRSVPLTRDRFRELTNTTRFDGSALTRVVGFEYAVGVQEMIRCLVKTYRHEGKL